MGTLCLIDRRARGLDPLEAAILCTLHDLVLEELLSRGLQS